jgi:glutamate transport system substrate-binding protein
MACAAVVLAAIVACGQNVGGVFGATVGAPASLRIGVRIDQPGVGLRSADGTLSGFEIDVARYVAADLGVDESRLSFVEARPADREAMLEDGEVDLVVATYSITAARSQRVDFAGPYLIAGQSLLVRRQNTDITGPESLDDSDWRLCGGTTGTARIRNEFAGRVSLSEFADYTQCVQALHRGAVDAVTGDDVILAGYAAQQPDEVKLVGKPFSVEPYGIGLRKGNPLRQRVNAAVRGMIGDGAWQRSARQHLTSPGYRIPPPPTIGR